MTDHCTLCGELLPPTSAAAHQCPPPEFNTNTGVAPTTLWEAKCFDCGTAWQAGDPRLPCPTCGGSRLYVGIAGNELVALRAAVRLALSIADAYPSNEAAQRIRRCIRAQLRGNGDPSATPAGRGDTE